MSESVKLANEYYQSTFDAGDAAEEEMWRQMDIDDDQWFNSDAYHEGKPRFSREWNKPMTQPAYTRDPEYVQFMRAIRANPADDLPRLVYADWLDEQAGSCSDCWPTPGTGNGHYNVSIKCLTCHGTGTSGAGERAEFIRLAIGNRSWNDVCELLLRCRSLREQESWGLPRECQIESETNVIALASINDMMVGISSRGFISHVRCTIAQFEQHAGEIARHHPVTRWELTDREPHSIQRFNGQIDYGWEWSNNFEEHQRFITAKLYERMTPGRTFNEFRTYYDTRKDATVALSAACVQVANERAEALENRPSYREVIDELFDAVVSGLGVPESILTAAP